MSKDDLKPCKHYIYYKVQNYYFGECDMCDEEKENKMQKEKYKGRKNPFNFEIFIEENNKENK